jgi:formamidopyrimidine-DNA glycosylase
LSPDFTVQYLSQALARRKTRIKALLLDQTFIAGLGNIYADECLFQARIHPERPACSLNPKETTRLHQAIVEIIARAIENRGTTFSTYVDGDGRRGNYAEMLKVYQRDGEPCPMCDRPLQRVKVGGRSSHFCPQCQPMF